MSRLFKSTKADKKGNEALHRPKYRDLVDDPLLLDDLVNDICLNEELLPWCKALNQGSDQCGLRDYMSRMLTTSSKVDEICGPLLIRGTDYRNDDLSWRLQYHNLWKNRIDVGPSTISFLEALDTLEEARPNIQHHLERMRLNSAVLIPDPVKLNSTTRTMMTSIFHLDLIAEGGVTVDEAITIAGYAYSGNLECIYETLWDTGMGHQFISAWREVLKYIAESGDRDVLYPGDAFKFDIKH